MDEGELLALLAGVRTTPIRVCRMNGYWARKIGASTDIVSLSRQSVAHIEAKHRDRDLKLYRLAATIINDGALYQISPNKIIAVWRSPPNAQGKSEFYKAVLKATRNGREMYLTSIHRIDERAVRALHKRATAIGGTLQV